MDHLVFKTKYILRYRRTELAYFGKNFISKSSLKFVYLKARTMCEERGNFIYESTNNRI